MNKYTITSLFICSILITACCLRGRDEKTFLLPTAVTDALPYTAGQEVLFLSNTGDTLKTKVRASTEILSSSCAECYCDTYKYENRSFNLIENNVTSVALIVADANFPAEIDLILGNSFFVFPLSSSGQFECDTSAAPKILCYPSLLIQNQVYQNVFQIDVPNVPDTAVYRIHYNAEKGLLMMEQKDGRYWEVL